MNMTVRTRIRTQGVYQFNSLINLIRKILREIPKLQLSVHAESLIKVKYFVETIL